jgi:hypothetical protein
MYPLEIPHRSVQIVIAPKKDQPFPIDAVAFEEDTFLVLSAETAVRKPQEPLIRIMTRVIETRPEIPGTILVKGKRPLRLLAIVHDLNQEPSWRKEWIQSALREIFKEVENRRLKSLALPFLGTMHGSLEKRHFVMLLHEVLVLTEFKHLKHLWLIVPPRTSREILKPLETGPHN